MRLRRRHLLASLCLLGSLLLPRPGYAERAPRQATTPPARVLGTLQSIDGKSLTVISDAGASTVITVEDATKILQVEPGKTDLKEATALAFTELQTGDRVLVRGVLADDGKTIRASSVIAIKKAALAEKQAKERAEWQHGVGGLVKSIDTTAGTVSLTTNSPGANKEVTVHFRKDTILRRYSPDSTRFDAAKVAPLSDIRAGDQLRARGARAESGTDFDAAEMVSGTFRSIAGTVSGVDAANNTLVVQDLASKSPVTLKISAESQMRKLPAQFAEGLAARLRSQAGGAPAAGQQPATGTSPASSPQSPATTQQGTAPGGQNSQQGARGAGPDFQQMIARMPAATMADLQKGDAVMVVTTQGNGKDPLTIITLLGGVEAILRASPNGSQDMLLSPWSLGGGEPAGN